jgi:hypothetical protein
MKRLRTWFRRRQEARALRARLRHYLDLIDAPKGGFVVTKAEIMTRSGWKTVYRDCKQDAGMVIIDHREGSK